MSLDDNSALVCIQPPSSSLTTRCNTLHIEGRSFQDHLKAFGKSATSLQKEFDSNGPCLSEDFQRSLWKLLLEMRPFLFLNAPEEVYAIPEEFRIYRTGNVGRDLRHVRLAVRLYLVVLRLAILQPTACLHGGLTLLALLPTLADPQLALRAHTQRYLEGLKFTLLVLYTHDLERFHLLMTALLSPQEEEGGLRNFLPSATGEARNRDYGRCFVEALPDTASLKHLHALLYRDSDLGLPAGEGRKTSSPQDLHISQERTFEQLRGLFRCRIQATTQYEVCTTAFGFCFLMNQFILWNCSISFDVFQASSLVDLSCGLLSTEVEEDAEAGGSGDSRLFSRQVLERRPTKLSRRESNANSHGDAEHAVDHDTSEEGGVKLTQFLHTEAWQMLINLLETHSLQYPNHSAAVLHAVVEWWWRYATCSAENEEGIVTAALPLRLLQWISIEAPPAPWMQVVFLQNSLHERIVSVVITLLELSLPRPPSSGSLMNRKAASSSSSSSNCETALPATRVNVFVASCLLSLLGAASQLVDIGTCQRTFFLYADSLPLSEHVERLLSLPLPYFAWRDLKLFSSKSIDNVFVVHRLASLFPRSLLIPLLDRADTLAKSCLPVGAYCVVAANIFGWKRCLWIASPKEEGSEMPGSDAPLRDTLCAFLENPESDFQLFIEAFTILLYYYSHLGCASSSEGVLSPALRILKALEEKLVQHNALLFQVSNDVWFLFYRLLAECLPIPRAKTDVAVYNALRRAFLVPSKGEAERETFSFRLAGIIAGLTTRLRGFLQNMPVFSRDEASQSLSLCSRSTKNALSSSLKEEEAKQVRMYLQCLFFLLQECDLGIESFIAALSLYKEGCVEPWLRCRRDGAALLFHAIAQFQLTILAAQGVLSKGERLLGRDGGNPLSMMDFHLVKTPNIIVDVDEDEEVGIQEMCGGGSLAETQTIAAEGENGGSNGSCGSLIHHRMADLHKLAIPLLVSLFQEKALTAHDDRAPSESLHSKTFTCLNLPHPCFHEIVDVNLLKCLCVSVALSPMCSVADWCFRQVIASHSNVVLRCGYGSFAFNAMMRSRGIPLAFLRNREENVARGSVGNRGWLGWEAPKDPEKLHDATLGLIHKMEFLQVTFTQNWNPSLRDDAADEDNVVLSVLGSIRKEISGPCLLSDVTQILHDCFQLWEDAAVPLAVRTVAAETACQLLGAIHWSTEDLCREMPDIVCSSFFAALCEMTETELKRVVTNSLDVLLARCLEEVSRDSKAGVERFNQLVCLLKDGLISNSAFSAMMAGVLYSGGSAMEKLSGINRLVGLLGFAVEEVPGKMKLLLAYVVLNIILCEASAQLAYSFSKCPPDAVTAEGEDAISVEATISSRTYSNFCLAIRQAVTLCDCGSAEPGVLLKALEKPHSVAVASQVLINYLFDVIDSISELMRVKRSLEASAPDFGERTSANRHGFSPAQAPLQQVNSAVSQTTLRRWLLGLCSFIQFMNQHATLVAAKLPSMLKYCYRIPSLLEVVCMVWSSLVDSCANDYLREHAPAIVVDLVSLDFTYSLSRVAVQILKQTIKRLYVRTASESFWQSYVRLMGTTSELMEAIRGEVGLDSPESAPEVPQQPTEGATQPPEASADAETRYSSVRKSFASPAALSTRKASVSAKPRLAPLEQANVVICGFLTIMRSSSRKCKAMSLQALHQYLQSADLDTRLAMSKVASENVDVIPTLLRCTRELDRREVQYVLSCIGVIGAMSPSIFLSFGARHGAADNPVVESRLVEDKKGDDTTTAAGILHLLSSHRYHLDADVVLSWRSLCGLLLEVYCPRALANTSNPAMHDWAAYAVQELLRICTKKERHEVNGITLHDDEMLRIEELNRYTWWTRLQPIVQKMLVGFMTTRYTTLIAYHTKRQTPEYCTGMPFLQWAFAMYQNLAARCTGWFSEVITSLRNVAKRDVSLMMFLLPYIVVHVLKHGDAVAHDDLLHEINAIFAAASDMSITGKEKGMESQEGHHLMSLRTQNPAEPTSPRVFSDWFFPATGVDEHAQYVLHLLEDISQLRWAMLRIGHKISRCRAIETDRYVEETCIHLAATYREFTDRVCWSKRALVGVAVGSYLRALRSVESQRRLPKVTDVISTVPLQRLFAAIGDRDSARSIHRLTRDLTASEAAFSLENNGDWLLALQHCELVLQHNPHSVPHQFTLLRCMRHLGQLHVMSRYAEASLGQAGLSAAASLVGRDARATMQNYANEAAWRLGEWGNVRAHVTLPMSLADPVVALMDAFRGAQPPAHVKAATAAQRGKLIDVVQATCREGYSQSYPHVVMLHGLADVDLVADLISSLHRPSCFGGAHGDARDGLAVDYSPLSQPIFAVPGRTDARRAPMAHHLTPLPDWGKHKKAVMSIVDALKARMVHLDHSLEAREPILSLHRSIYRALGLNQEVSQTWIEYARLLRDAGFFEAALNAARQSDYNVVDPSNSAFYVLNAEILHDMNANTEAIEFAQKCVENNTLSSAMRAQLQFLLTNWKLEVGSQPPKEAISAYEAALLLDPSSEDAHHYLALFYDKLYAMSSQHLELPIAKKLPVTPSASSPADKANTERIHTEIIQTVENYAQFAVKHFGKALLRGYATMSVSLPRMLTLWLDTTSVLFDLSSLASPPATIAKADHLLKHLNTLIEGYLLTDGGEHSCIPPKVVMTALPQLLSRLCHPSAHVGSIVTRTVVSLMQYFPQQCLWMVLPIVFSNQEARSKIAKLSIINPFIQQKIAHKVHLENAYVIMQSFIDLCNCPASVFSNNAKLTRQPFIQKAEKIMPAAKFIVPTMNNLTPEMAAEHNKDVFPCSPWFHHFDEKVRVMSSLQMPKRIWVHTNEGDTVSFLCKAKDEPRKDIRMMEIASLMNTFFLKDPDARRRRFSLRRYSIAALTDDCALIEWVNHLSPLRNVVNQTYALDGSGVRISDVKKWYAKVEAKSLSKLDLFSQYILPAAPPVLHQWFDMAFASNQEWYQARNLFTQSTALWSIAGHIVGLGDRHGENLMIDLRHGEMLHVDFACMFDKGETLEIPERVRFRLTQNLVDGMGVLGVEGPFRTNCEVALRCQIKNKKAVMSIVETLLHDPLVEWSGRGSRRPAVAPKRLVGRVSRRLDGFLDLYSNPREEDKHARNVEDQVSKLISHSSALENLSEMYIWWMAWI